jgi:ribosomal protein L16/L10AE
MGKGKGAVEYWAAVVKPEELCLKLEEFLCQLQKGVTSCGSKASS